MRPLGHLQRWGPDLAWGLDTRISIHFTLEVFSEVNRRVRPRTTWRFHLADQLRSPL